MTGIEFIAWPATPRLRRNITVTEKIDGTNAAVRIVPIESLTYIPEQGVYEGQDQITSLTDDFAIVAQSRKRIITPTDDNFGFARWVAQNAESLVADLGEGNNFGEWWGSGIQRGYGLSEKRFSLFNTTRYGNAEFTTPGLGVVPVLYQGIWSEFHIQFALDYLSEHGSLAAPGFLKPEGVCVFASASNSVFKVTLENDDVPKSLAGAL